MQNMPEWRKRARLAKKLNDEIVKKIMDKLDGYLLEMTKADKKEGEREQVCEAGKRLLEKRRGLREWRRRKRS